MKAGQWVLLTSVWHTGTRFMQRELFIDFNFSPIRVGFPKQATMIHMEKRHRKVLEDRLYSCDYVVVPLRHPVNIWRSWKARHKPLDLLREQLQILTELVAPVRPIYLPLDHSEREWYLSELNSRMDADFQTEFPVVKHEVEPGTLNPEELREAHSYLFHEPFSSIYR